MKNNMVYMVRYWSDEAEEWKFDELVSSFDKALNFISAYEGKLSHLKQHYLAEDMRHDGRCFIGNFAVFKVRVH